MSGPVRVAPMGSRVRRGGASGPAEWLLVFLQARDVPPRARSGAAAGPSEWLLVFLEAAALAPSRGRSGAVRFAGPLPGNALAGGSQGGSQGGSSSGSSGEEPEARRAVSGR